MNSEELKSRENARGGGEDKQRSGGSTNHSKPLILIKLDKAPFEYNGPILKLEHL